MIQLWHFVIPRGSFRNAGDRGSAMERLVSTPRLQIATPNMLTQVRRITEGSNLSETLAERGRGIERYRCFT